MASSSNVSIQTSFKYDVFLNFRGADTRKNFVDHLYAALRRQGIHTFKDDERIEQGKKIDHQLIEFIKDSKLFIIVFSKNYASSSWCLDELVKIMECHKRGDQIAYPVFYDVTPSDVRKQSGAFGDAFSKNKNKISAQKWRDAMKDAADLAGWELKEIADGHEAKFIKKVVGKISLKLHSTTLSINDELIGMEPRIKLLLSSIDMSSGEVCMIGIKGIGGGGKTSLARAFYEQLSLQFDAKSYVERVSEVSKKSSSGLKSLQQQILSNILNDQKTTVSNIHDGKITMKKRLCGHKVLIVLDNVDHTEQLEALAGAPDWFGPGSIIIITTRDKHVLVAHKVNVIHEVNLLEDEEAYCLFKKYASHKDFPPDEMLSRQVVRYAAGLPLTIKVLGGVFCGKEKGVWKDALDRLKKIPEKEIQEKLELSYKDLDKDLKEIFLDVACLLKGWEKESAIRALKSCGFNASFGLSVLEERSLITISDDHYLGMHESIQEMGRNIVRRHSEPSRHNRLWIPDEIKNILAKGLGTKVTRAITMDDSLVKLSSEMVTKGFVRLKNLRFLCVVSEVAEDNSLRDEMTDQVSPHFPEALQYLDWVRYPYPSLPKKFQADNLVALVMPYCKIIQVWDGGERKVFDKLKFLNLMHSQLTTIDLGLTPNLERLDLEDCYQLVQIDMSVEFLKELVYLNLSGCSDLKIESFLFIKRLESLKVLCLNRLHLKQFPDIIPGEGNSALLELRFRSNDIEELPSSIANFQELVHLDLHSCRKLRSLPVSICGLRRLRTLKLYGCILEELPESIGLLECLEKLNLSFAHIKHLPDSICMLKNLKTLDLSSCLNLEKLPQDLGKLECLENLILKECQQVTDIPDSTCELRRLKYFSLLDCVQLYILPKKLGDLKCLKVLNLKGTRIRHLPQDLRLLKGLEIFEPDSLHQLCSTASTTKTLKAASSFKKRKW
ncbi:disease resistance protein (TIR-NBS-LRR class) [Artemisia annua]|uniref:Disease resistance protein (TIR-NBS-LRR class) n=1 Tax=Artemisia annua TaxID=35608 RepID=A0A2U1QLS1_ARTAN|nr:disease resistance protein (TIR-NBS-LRR class) [Artemisia annua]